MLRRPALYLSAVSALTIAACGSPSKPEVKAPSTDSTTAADAQPGDKTKPKTPADEPAQDDGMPTKCAKRDGELCLPSPRFARLVCQREYPSVAYAMFAKDTPWTRAYLTTNAGGAQKDEVARDEEVIILSHRAVAKTEIQVSGVSDSYEVIRWNGACTMLVQEEIRFEPSPSPVNARIIWKRLEVDIREALKKDEEIYAAYIQLRKTCKGVSVGSVSDKCVVADTAMSQLLAQKARAGIAIPTPKKLPSE